MREFWFRRLAYPVVPITGPLRPSRTLAEARQGMHERLPAEFRARPLWIRTIALIDAAGKSGTRDDIRLATDQLQQAIGTEGWLR